MRVGIILAVAWLLGLAAAANAAPAAGTDDWPQLGHDAGRTARAPQGVAPPFRARWIWCGPQLTLRNRAANAGWSDELAPGHGPVKDYAIPDRAAFTLAGRVQPVVAGGKVFIADLEGHVYALALDDGRTLWTRDLAPVDGRPIGTCGAAAVSGDTVIVTGLAGGLTGFDTNTGAPRWHVDTPKAITSAALVIGDVALAGCHDGKVYAVEAATGKLRWATPLGAPVVGDLCGDAAAVYVGSEDLWFSKLDLATGRVLARTRLMGQSFRMTHPMLHQGLLFVQTVQAPCVGSEYVMEDLMRDSPDLASEQDNVLRWLKGDTNGGQWRDASAGWKHLFILKAEDLSEPCTVPNGPADGCGSPAPSPCVDGQDRVLAWFKTRYPTLTAKGAFGTKYSMDISAIDRATGRRVPIDNGRLSGTTGESDNLFALSAGGPFLYLRQEFRGSKLINLQTSQAHMIQAAVRTRDGGTWNADVIYRERGRTPRGAQPELAGRAAVVIAGDKLLWAEPYCVTCVEHQN